MPKNNLNVTLKGLDELLFSTEEQRQFIHFNILLLVY